MVGRFADVIMAYMCRILAEARKAGDERARRLTTATLNPVIQEAITFRHPPAGKANKRGRIYYCTQVRGQEWTGGSMRLDEC